MIISLIAALSKNNVIGKSNDLPWSLPDDMKYFMQTTKEHYIVMGRKNYDSIPVKFKPLPNRTNIIITRQPHFLAPNCSVVNSLEEAVSLARKNAQSELFIIGGADIYRLALPIADRLYLTEIDAIVEGDTFFPKIEYRNWKEISRRTHQIDERHAYSFDFVIYEKIA